MIGSSLANLLIAGHDQSPEAQPAADTGDDLGAADATGVGYAVPGGWSGSDWGSGGGDVYSGGDVGGGGDFGGFRGLA